MTEGNDTRRATLSGRGAWRNFGVRRIAAGTARPKRTWLAGRNTQAGHVAVGINCLKRLWRTWRLTWWPTWRRTCSTALSRHITASHDNLRRLRVTWHKIEARHHLLLAGFVLALTTTLSLMSADDVEAKRTTASLADVTVNRLSIPLELPIDRLLESPSSAPAQIDWRDITIEPGDNLSLIFRRVGLSYKDVYNITRRRNGRPLTRIYPGQNLSLHIDESGELQALRYQPTKLKTMTYTRKGRRFSVETVEREPEIYRNFARVTIQSSLYADGRSMGLSHDVIMQLADIFGGVIDFALQPRAGDNIYVLYEEIYLNGEKLNDGNILAAKFVNRGKSHTAYRYVDESGRDGYYDLNGVSMRKAFLLAPLDFTRVSSNFNPRRLHPIYKTRRPHRGIDYAAPRGTPVYAASDGRIIEAGYTRANGNYVVIRHGETYTTKYLHLHRRKVRTGQRVQQNQVVGTVGSTGAATGPHLHYEFLVNGVHKNPRTIHKKLPKAKSLAKAQMPIYLNQTRSSRMQFAIRQQQLLALNTK